MCRNNTHSVCCRTTKLISSLWHVCGAVWRNRVRVLRIDPPASRPSLGVQGLNGVQNVCVPLARGHLWAGCDPPKAELEH